ncbi:hypothetical protein KP509_14G065300 [Ceratopteris richardii]|uniref:GrpE protein homolog n=1 Tax=Ceratopteris richardii TaxID=49495 RepID=A0A8T2TDV4_CERRI|nr:hypothetical protein KP509_14G065300 [Ceratopteris richardii]
MAMAGAISSSNSSSFSAKSSFLQDSRKIFLQRSYVSFPLAPCRVRSIVTLCPPRKQRPFFTYRAAQADAKVRNDQENVEANDSEYGSSDDENDGSTNQETFATSVDVILKKYREAVSNNDEGALEQLDAVFHDLEEQKNAYAKQVSTLNEEIIVLKDRLLRLNADFDNFRKRSERDRMAVSDNVKGDVISSLLPMVDNFERARTQIKIETEGEQRIDSSYQGIYKQFVEIMKGLGVSAIETVGKEFDPNVQEAIMREESSEYPEGIVIEEFRRGFVLGEKLLRPAMVKVSAGPPSAPASATEPDDSNGSSELAQETDME